MSPSGNCLGILSILSIVFSSSALSQPALEPAQWFIKSEPSSDYRYQDDDVNEVEYAHFCYNYTTGLPLPCQFEYEYLGYDTSSLSDIETELNCEFHDSGAPVNGTCGNGGHSHNSTRPHTYIGTSVRLLNADDEDVNPYGVKGVQPTSSDSENYKIVLDSPESSGYYSWTMKIRLPGGFGFASPWGENGVSFDGSQMDVLGTNIIAVKDLMQFPAGENYVKVRSPDTRHVNQDAYQITGAMYDSLNAFSFEYRLLSGFRDYRISFNDMSLPLGGLFDINGSWTRPHGSHRHGRDADLNKIPGNAESGYVAPPCEQDYLLHRAAEMALLPLDSRSSPVLCEPGNRRHLDFSPVLKSMN